MIELIDREALLSKRGELAYCEVCPVWNEIKDAPTIAAPRWVRVEDEPPEEGRYLVWEVGGFVYCDTWKEGKWQIASSVPGTHITHWMPIEPPKEEET